MLAYASLCQHMLLSWAHVRCGVLWFLRFVYAAVMRDFSLQGFCSTLWAHFGPLFCSTVSHFWKLLCGMQVDRHPLKWGGHLEPLARQRLTCHNCLQHLGDRWAQTPWFPQDDILDRRYLIMPLVITQMSWGRPPGEGRNMMWKLCGSYAAVMRDWWAESSTRI